MVALLSRTLLIATLCLPAAILVLPTDAAAQNESLEKARQHFERGTAFYREGKYDQALDELMKAYVLDPNPILVYNIARVNEDRQDLQSALKFFENYLKMSPKAKNRRAVKRKIRKLRKEIKRNPRMGILAVTSTPRGADVRMNGQIMGRTPIKARRMNPGRYRLEVTLRDHQVWVQDVLLNPGQPTNVDVTLVDVPSPLRIDTTPPGAVAQILSPRPQMLGTCPCLVNLSSGRYVLRVGAPGFQDRQVEIIKKPRVRQTVPVTLLPARTGGKLYVESNVPGAFVSIDGQPIGQTPMPGPIDIRNGVVNVEVRAQGHLPWRQPVQILAQGITRVQALLRPAGVNPVNPLIREPDRPKVIIRDGGGSNTAGVTLTVVGGVLTLGGAASFTFALLEKREYDSGEFFKNQSPPQANSLLRQDITQVQAFEKEELANTLAIAGYAAAGVGLTLTIVGIVMLSSDSGVDDSISFHPLEGGGLMSFQTEF